MSEIHLSDLSKIYKEQIVEKKDDSYLEPDMKKRQKNNEKARKELAKGPQMKNPHFEEKDPFGRPGGKYGGVPKKGGGYDKAYQSNMKKVKELDKKEGWDVVNSLSDVFKAMQEGKVDTGKSADTKATARNDRNNPVKGDPGFGKFARATFDRQKEGQSLATGKDSAASEMRRKAHAQRRGVKKEELELDENRRAARAAGGYKDDSKKQNDPSKAGFTGIGNMSIDQIRKMSARMDKEKTQKEGLDPVGKEDSDVNNDGKKDKTDKYLMNRRKAIGSAIKNKMSSMKKEETEAAEYIETVAKVKEAERQNDIKRWVQKESRSSNWRNDLSEVMTDDIDSKPIKEKNVKNKIKINPKLGEAIEEIGGTLIEAIEIDEMDYVIESVYSELIEEGHSEDDVESAIERALNEAEVTMGHDTPGRKERTRDKLKQKAKGFLGKVRYKAYHAARDAKRAATPMAQRIKTSAKRGVRKAALKVADKLKEENVDEGKFTGSKSSVDRNSAADSGGTNAAERRKDRRTLATYYGDGGKKSAIERAKKERDEKRAARMSEEIVGEAVYGDTPEKKKDDRMIVTNADKKANTPAYRAYKAGNKKYKSADHMGEEVETEGYEPMTPERKLRVDRAKRNAYDNDQRAQRSGDNKEADKQFKRRMAMDSKTKMKKEEVENIEELHKGRHGQSEKEYQDGRSMAGKMVSGDSKGSGANYSYRAKNTGSNPAGGSEKPQGQARMGSKDRAYLKMQKANLRKEEASMSPQELQLQKKKAMLDRMIAQRRQQGLNKTKKSEAPTKAMGEEAECDHSMKGKECPIHGKKDCSSMKEATEDSLKDRRMERGGVDGNNRYNKPVSNTPNTFGKKKPKYDGMSALEKVKASIRAKHGQGAIKEDAKMAKQSDEKLAALHKQVSASDQSLPSNQFMMKRVSKEMNRRKKAT